MSSTLRRVRNILLTGLLAILPLYFTVVALRAVFNLVDQGAAEWVKLTTGYDFPGAGVVATVVIVFLIGLVVSAVGLPRFGAVTESVLNRVPGMGRLYRAFRSLLDPLARPETRPFREAVWLEVGEGVRLLGFLTSGAFRDPDDGEERVSVYLPMSHPYVGYVIAVPRRATRICRATFEEVVGYHLSCGAALPVNARTTDR